MESATSQCSVETGRVGAVRPARALREIAQNDQISTEPLSHPEMLVETSAKPMPRYLALFKYSEAGAKGLIKAGSESEALP
jgi:hypothetical protein